MTDPSPAAPPPVSANVVWHPGAVARESRLSSGATIWFTGFSGSGKSTIAAATEALLIAAGRPAYLVDGDNVRHGLNGDLGFSAADRSENVRRIGEVGCLLADAGVVALIPVISPYRADRERARARHAAAGVPFYEVHVATPIERCEARDPKGLYARVRAGELTGFTGIDDPYEAPEAPDLVVGVDDATAEESAAAAAALLGVVPSADR